MKCNRLNMLRQLAMMRLLWLPLLLLLLLAMGVERTLGLETEPCLSAEAIAALNLSALQAAGSRLPLECQCSRTDLVCANVKAFEAQPVHQPMGNLSLLFAAETTTTTTTTTITPKYRYLFVGYKLAPRLFDGVRLVDAANASGGHNVFINFMETLVFPRGLFASFGNLEAVARDLWPPIQIIITNKLASSLELESGSLANLRLDKLAIQFDARPARKLKTSALVGSHIRSLEIRKAAGFAGFSDLVVETQRVKRPVVRQLLIDQCVNFELSAANVPASFAGVRSVAVTNSALVGVDANVWQALGGELETLSLSGNRLESLDETSFHGLEHSLLALDLSHNPLSNLSWGALNQFKSLRSLDLSHTRIKSIYTWPISEQLAWIGLRGYDNFYFKRNKYICVMNAFGTEYSRADHTLTANTFVELDDTFACDCFLYYVHRSYRLHHGLDSLVSTTSTTQRHLAPACYRRQSEETIEAEEAKCRLEPLIHEMCDRDRGDNVHINVNVDSGNSDESAVNSPPPSSCIRNETFTRPGVTTIVVGNHTTTIVTDALPLFTATATTTTTRRATTKTSTKATTAATKTTTTTTTAAATDARTTTPKASTTMRRTTMRSTPAASVSFFRTTSGAITKMTSTTTRTSPSTATTTTRKPLTQTQTQTRESTTTATTTATVEAVSTKIPLTKEWKTERPKAASGSGNAAAGGSESAWPSQFDSNTAVIILLMGTFAAVLLSVIAGLVVHYRRRESARQAAASVLSNTYRRKYTVNYSGNSMF